MKTLEVELLSNAVNAAVVRLPDRSFPGIVIQGDSLYTLWIAAHSLMSDPIPDRDDAEELADRLRSFVEIYEETLKREGIQLPYVKITLTKKA